MGWKITLMGQGYYQAIIALEIYHYVYCLLPCRVLIGQPVTGEAQCVTVWRGCMCGINGCVPTTALGYASKHCAIFNGHVNCIFDLC